MTTPKQDDWMQTVLEVPKERFNLSPTAGAPAGKPPAEGDRVRLVAANALKLIALAQDNYRETQAGVAQASFAKLDDPGPKIQKLAADVQKAAASATSLLKQGEIGKAAKIADAAEAQARDAFKLATDYAVALDHASVTQMAQVTNTPWGPVTLPTEASIHIDNFIVPLSKVYEMEKTALAQYQAQSSAQQAAMKPIMAYLAKPETAAAEIAKYASDKSVQWAEQTNTSELLQAFVKHYRKTLGILLKNAKDQYVEAQHELASADLKDQAAGLRERAEKIAKVIDTLVDIVVGAAKIAIGGPEEIAGVAADVVGGLIKTFKTSGLLEEAGKLEEDAKKLDRERINISLQSATEFLTEIDSQLTDLEPLAKGTGDDAERKMARAAKQFDTDCDKDKGGHACHFRFRDVATAQKGMKQVMESAHNRWAVWAGAEANRSLFVSAMKEVSDFYVANNAKVIDDAQREIAKHTAECDHAVQTTTAVSERLDLLFKDAMASLTKARQTA